MATDLRTNHQRLWQSLMDMGRIGATAGGGVGRLALTELDREARDLFVRWCQDTGCLIRIDRMGNIFARRAGTDSARAPVMTGSHLDTQPLGGKFDGIYGVLAGLEILRTLNDAGVRTRAPLDIVNWTDEEGVRFGSGTLASAVFSGLCELDDALARTDLDGNTFASELEHIGYAGAEPVGGFPVAAFFEAHIEQGPILEAEGKTIGVVLGAQGQRCFKVSVEGEEGHAGTLPMERRRDALVGAARMIDALNAIAFRHEPHPVITVGAMKVRPNSRNTIPGQVVFSIDSRHPDNDLLAVIAKEMQQSCEHIASDMQLVLTFEQISERATNIFDARCIASIRNAAERLGISHRDMHSGAGHDACNLAHYAPTGMIFVPCENGISHNEKENARPEDLAAGCDVLLHVILEHA
ncbi:MAG: Zn-dependent hydrolase, partial [Acidiferrobacterales bacterium]|nr:Zn-dependent hydrolase [Acidiferrobacterales bacterium]